MARAANPTAALLVPKRPSLRSLRSAAGDCTACPLYENATQTVFGSGPAKASVVLVGEQPGDVEDGEGEPFVGPAGRELDRALERVGIARDEVYLTNAVKHFKWKPGGPGGKRRIHQRPNAMETAACAPWLEAELAVIAPGLVVAMGATAARSLFGAKVRVTRDRGQALESELSPHATVTVHPSSLLRLRDRDERRLARAEFERDLAEAYGWLGR